MHTHMADTSRRLFVGGMVTSAATLLQSTSAFAIWPLLFGIGARSVVSRGLAGFTARAVAPATVSVGASARLGAHLGRTTTTLSRGGRQSVTNYGVRAGVKGDVRLSYGGAQLGLLGSDSHAAVVTDNHTAYLPAPDIAGLDVAAEALEPEIKGRWHPEDTAELLTPIASYGNDRDLHLEDGSHRRGGTSVYRTTAGRLELRNVWIGDSLYTILNVFDGPRRLVDGFQALLYQPQGAGYGALSSENPMWSGRSEPYGAGARAGGPGLPEPMSRSDGLGSSR